MINIDVPDITVKSSESYRSGGEIDFSVIDAVIALEVWNEDYDKTTLYFDEDGVRAMKDWLNKVLP